MQPHQINYSTADVPTLERFFRCDAPLRAIRGPFRCLSGDTEFLTPQGWKRMDAYVPGDVVAQWTPDAAGGLMDFVIPGEHIVDDTTDLLQFDCGHGLKMRVSDDHRIPHYNWAGTFQVKTAAEIALRPSKRTIPTTFRGHDNPGLGMSDDFIRFAVMMHADGHYPKRGKRACVCVRKERKKIRVRRLLTALGVEWRETTSAARPIETKFTFESPYVGKRYDGDWWKANRHELAVVLDEMPYWDGLFDGAVSIFSSAHKIDADFIQYAAHANGLRATMSVVKYPDKPNWKPAYRLCIRMGDNPKNRACIREGTKISRVPALNGKMYCFTVPSGFFIARCDDTIFITGNSGKSSASVIEIIERGIRQKPGPDGVSRSRWIVVRNTFGQLQDSTIRTTHMWFPPERFGKWQPSNSGGPIYTIKALRSIYDTRCEIEIWFRALDRPDHVAKLLSVEVTGGWVNEAREVPWSIIDALQGRVGQYPPKKDGGPTWFGLWMDTNPPDSDSKWYKFFEEQVHDPTKVVQFVQPSGLSAMAENLNNLPQRDYYQRLAYGKDPEWIKVYIDGEYGYVADGRPIYPTFSQRLHVQNMDPIPDCKIIRSWDFGLTPACAFSQYLPDGRWLVFDEMVSENMSIDEFSDDVLEHCAKAFRGKAVFEDWGDPAGDQRAQTDKRSCFDIMKKKGIQIEPSIQEPTLRWEAVRKPLRTLSAAAGGEPQFVINPRCKVLIKGFKGAYQFRRLATSREKYSDHAEKNEVSHIHDALQYGMAQYFAPQLVDQEPNDTDLDWESGSVTREYRDSTRSDVTGY